MTQSGATTTNRLSRPVVLLHGLGRTSASMWPLALRLRRAGFEAQSLNYPSTRLTLAEACAFVRDALVGLHPDRKFDLVGHSMGGLIARRLGLEDGPLDIHRIVQLGSPNLGSPLADRMGPLWAVRKACGPAIHDLNVKTGTMPKDRRVAAIAGVTGCATRYAGLSGPHDGVVSVRSAWAGADRRYCVKQMHSLLPASRPVAEHVIADLMRKIDSGA